jgi:uncharacterized protein YbaR (Trm112 family)
MELSQTLIDALRCPQTNQPLQRANNESLAPFQAIDANLTDALITQDGHYAYPIDDGYPILLADRAIQIKA